MNYSPGNTFYGEFVTSRFDTGNATDADTLPVATANRNGVDDGSFALTVTKLDTGRYKAAGQIPIGYAAGDVINISVAATVNSVVGKAPIASFVLVAAVPNVNVAQVNTIAVHGTGTASDPWGP